MSDQTTQPPGERPRPPTDRDPNVWRAYWQELGQPWRREPEIDEKRQIELANHRAGGGHPFEGVKLSRQDVEWLLATHEDGQGPVDWSDENQRSRRGLRLSYADLRGADLAGSPYGYIDNGQPKRGWRCPSLLTAIYFMLWLDVTQGRSFPRCERGDCGRYYRSGLRSTDYCSKECKSVVLTRRSRVQES